MVFKWTPVDQDRDGNVIDAWVFAGMVASIPFVYTRTHYTYYQRVDGVWECMEAYDSDYYCVVCPD